MFTDVSAKPVSQFWHSDLHISSHQSCACKGAKRQHKDPELRLCPRSCGSSVAVPGHLTLNCPRPHSIAAGSLSLRRPPLRESRDHQDSTLEITKYPKRPSKRGATPLRNNELRNRTQERQSCLPQRTTYQWTELHNQQVGGHLSTLGQALEQVAVLQGPGRVHGCLSWRAGEGGPDPNTALPSP